MTYSNQAFTIAASDLTTPTSQTAVITGGSSGIGLQTAIILHALGNNIGIIDRHPPTSSSDPSSPSHAPASLLASPRFAFAQADITSWASHVQAFETLHRQFQRIDTVFVNAGIAEHGDQFFSSTLDPATGLLSEPDRRVIDVDLQAADDSVRLAIHYLRKNEKDAQGKRGSIVMTASLAGYLASAGAPLYSAAKHGVVGLMRALKNDLATLGIAISVVAPAITLTPIISGRRPGQSLEDWAREMRRVGVPINSPEEIARAVVWLVGKGLEANGMGLLVQAGRVADLEAGIAKTRALWMGEEMLGLFRGGRKAPLFPNKL
jgi:NAD(P)-dependent dehydrogenase (short-subunit alcohol dehydrogenase family)